MEGVSPWLLANVLAAMALLLRWVSLVGDVEEELLPPMALTGVVAWGTCALLWAAA